MLSSSSRDRPTVVSTYFKNREIEVNDFTCAKTQENRQGRTSIELGYNISLVHAWACGVRTCHKFLVCAYYARYGKLPGRRAEWVAFAPFPHHYTVFSAHSLP